MRLRIVPKYWYSNEDEYIIETVIVNYPLILIRTSFPNFWKDEYYINTVNIYGGKVSFIREDRSDVRVFGEWSDYLSLISYFADQDYMVYFA